MNKEAAFVTEFGLPPGTEGSPSSFDGLIIRGGSARKGGIFSPQLYKSVGISQVESMCKVREISHLVIQREV